MRASLDVEELVPVLAFTTALGVKLRLLDLFQKFRVKDRGRNSVAARRPLAEVEKAAPVGAEGKVFARGFDGFPASGTEDGLGWHTSYSIILATTS